MKTSFHRTSQTPHRPTCAFTLIEMLISMGIFVGLFVGLMVGLQLFGLRVYTLAATKLSATADARRTLGSLRRDIRSSREVYVGTYQNDAFSRIPNNQPQTGNALEIFAPDANGNANATPVIYYQNSGKLCYLTNGIVSVLANYVTNYDVFTAEDYRANVLTTYDNNPVICVTLDFSQWEYPVALVGGDGINAYDFYRLQTQVSRRLKDLN